MDFSYFPFALSHYDIYFALVHYKKKKIIYILDYFYIRLIFYNRLFIAQFRAYSRKIIWAVVACQIIFPA